MLQVAFPRHVAAQRGPSTARDAERETQIAAQRSARQLDLQCARGPAPASALAGPACGGGPRGLQVVTQNEAWWQAARASLLCGTSPHRPPTLHPPPAPRPGLRCPRSARLLHICPCLRLRLRPPPASASLR
eukprot:2202202-Rhodomonas_salina.1